MSGRRGAFNRQSQSAMRIPSTKDGTEAETPARRNRRVSLILAGWALNRPDPEDWLRDALSALGLDGKTDAPPAPHQVIGPAAAKAPGKRSPRAPRYGDEP